MRTLIQVCCAVVVMASLSSCTGFKDNYAEGFSPMYDSFMENEYWRMSDQSEYIAEIASQAKFDTKVEAALFKVMAVQAIRDIPLRQFTVKAPTTGYDVLNTAVGQLPTAIFGLTTYGIAKRGLQTAGTTNVTAQNMSLKDAFNQTNVTTAGSSGAVSAPASSQTTETTATTSSETTSTGVQ